MNPKKALIIDGSDMGRDGLSVQMKLLGYETLQASGGIEGVQVFDRQKDDIAVVLVDVDMPVMDGLQTYKVLRNLKPGVRVILTTTDRENGLDKKLGAGPAPEVLQKPLSTAELSAALAGKPSQ